MFEKEKVFLLKKTIFSEADLILHGLNSKGSKISVLAKCARKSRKRFGGGILQPTHLLEWVYSKRKSQELGVLKEASLKTSFQGLRKDFKRLELGLYFVKLMDCVSLQGMSSHSSMFHLLGHGLKQAEMTSDLSKLKIHFEMKFLFEQGVLSCYEYRRFLSKPLYEHLKLKNLEDKKHHISQEVSIYLNKRFDKFFLEWED